SSSGRLDQYLHRILRIFLPPSTRSDHARGCRGQRLALQGAARASAHRGGCTALISVIVVFAGCALVQFGRLICGERVRLPSVIVAICLTMLAAAVIS